MDLESRAKGIEANIERIVAEIELDITVDDPAGMLNKLNRLVSISALGATSYAEARELYRQAQEDVIRRFIASRPDLPASTLNDFIKAKTGKYEALQLKCERLDNKIGYALDALRTMISLYKEELNKAMMSPSNL